MNTIIPATDKKRVVIVGAGFGGLKVADALSHSDFQVVMIDRENYHQFQPLIYQVATSGLEPSAISFPVRKNFQRACDFHFRLCSLVSIDAARGSILTSIGEISYDYLVVATGTTTNFFGMQNIEREAKPMKTVSEAIALRNHILLTLERATVDPDDESLRTMVVVGGGATGVEIAGALADMRRYIISKDYPELRDRPIRIVLVEASDRLLSALDKELSAKALRALEKMGVEVCLNTAVANYAQGEVVMKDGTKIAAEIFIWVSGVTVEAIEGLNPELYARGRRITVDPYNRIEGRDNIFVIGDAAYQTEAKYPTGHPQVAPVAIGQGAMVAKNIVRMEQNKPLVPFAYKDQGSMATIGRGEAVVQLGEIHLSGYLAWIAWLGVHLISIIGTRNKIQTLMNWFWNYITFDQSLRLIIRTPQHKKQE